MEGCFKNKLDVAVEWAWPVSTARLGAHLEAYKRALPAITTLRLCNRFGQGEKAYITKLPIELVTSIEHHLAANQRKKYLKKWQRKADCASNEWGCSNVPCMLSHLSSDDIKYVMEECDCYISPESTRHDNTATLKRYLDEDELWDVPQKTVADSGAHMKARHKWRSSVKRESLYSDVVGDLLETCFGLRPWISLERDLELEQTRTYLVPHNGQAIHAASVRSSSEETELDFQSGLDIPINLSARTVDKIQQRFGRALAALGLACANSQEDQSDGTLAAADVTNVSHD